MRDEEAAEQNVPTWRQDFGALLRHPAMVLFAVLWLVSAVCLRIGGFTERLTFGLATVAGVLLFSALTVAVARNPATVPSGQQEGEGDSATPERGSRRMLWLQLGAVLVFILITFYEGLVSIPLWSAAMDAVREMGRRFLSDAWFGSAANAVANPMRYFVIPFLVLLALGARPRALGLGKGRRTWKVVALWCSIPAVLFVVRLSMGAVTVTALLRQFLAHFFQNGFFEEFLFRGALQTRLEGLVDANWSLVLQALLFGLWHLGVGYSDTGGESFLMAAASTIVSQATMGLAYGLIFQRTRSLVGCSLVHVVSNMS